MAHLVWKPEDVSFIESVRRAAREILVETTKFKESVLKKQQQAQQLLEGGSEFDVDDDSVNLQSKQTSDAVNMLVEIVKKRILESHDSELTFEQNFLLDACKQVKLTGYDFVDVARACAANPFDILSLPKLHKSAAELAESIKRLLNAVTKEVQSNQPPQPTANEPVKPVTQPSVDVTKEAAPSSSIQNNTKSSPNLIEEFKNIINALRLMNSSIENRDVALFKTSTTQFVQVMKNLLQLSVLYQINMEPELKEGTINTTNAGRIAISSSPDDSVNVTQWMKAKHEMSKVLQTFYFYASSKSPNPAPQHMSFDKLMKEEKPEKTEDKEDQQSAKENALKELGTQLIQCLNVIKDRFREELLEYEESEDEQQREMSKLYKQSKELQKEFDPVFKSNPKIQLVTNQPIAITDQDTVKELLKVMNTKSIKEWQLIIKDIESLAVKLQQNHPKMEKESNYGSLVLNKADISVDEELKQLADKIPSVMIELTSSISDLLAHIESDDQNVVQPRAQKFEKSISRFFAVITLSVELAGAWFEGRKFRNDGSKRRLEKSAGKKTLNTEGDKLHALVEKILTSTFEKLTESSKKGELDQDIISTINDAGNTTIENFQHLKLRLEEALAQRTYSSCYEIRILLSQLVALLVSLAQEHDRSKRTIVLQLVAQVRALSKRIQIVLNSQQTIHYLANAKNLLHTPSQRLLKGGLGDDPTDINIWDDVKTKPIMGSSPNEFVGGTLNQIMIYLTSVQDTSFLSTFIITYQSFTTPWIVLNKLSQRYNEPPVKKGGIRDSVRGMTDKESLEMLRVKLRVCVVLKYWIEEQFDDFDSELVLKLRQFITETIRKDPHKEMGEMAKRLENSLNEKMEARKGINAAKLISELKVENIGLNVPLFLNSNDSEIARQLTLIEYEIFKKIKPSEFLNQAWNKPKVQYKSPNICRLINRSNKMSFWVASLILWHSRLNDRVKIIEKFIQIANILKVLNNFNTMVAIVAGLNVSAVSRLKHTWSKISPICQSMLPKLQTIFDPSSSFKTYRNARKDATSKGPVMPYIGVPLSDLTFSEDGNPDLLDKTTDAKGEVINFSKRELICKIILEIRLNQQDKYPFKPVEPLYSYLSDLACFEEKELYDLSLIMEPRNSDISQIEM